MYDLHHRKKKNCAEEMLSKGNITVTQNFLHCMFKRNLGVLNMHILEIAYVMIMMLNQTYKGKIIGLCHKANIHINIYYKHIEDKRKHSNQNTSVLAMHK